MFEIFIDLKCERCFKELHFVLNAHTASNEDYDTIDCFISNYVNNILGWRYDCDKNIELCRQCHDPFWYDAG